MIENQNQPASALQPSGSEPWFISCFLGLLLTWRWMVPVESATLGETLWISQFSLLLPIACAVWIWNQHRVSLIWGRFDSCLWVIVIGHWCSLFWLLKTGGDLRSALNLCWEWTAIGCTLFAIRQSLRSPEAKSDLLRLVLVVGICLAGIGLWQHFVAYRIVLADYQSMQQSYDSLSQKAATGMLTRMEQEKFRQLELDFQQMNVPTQGASRQMFERRLADNRQPVGRWALTNSLGGMLALTTVLLFGAILTNSGQRSVNSILLIAVLYCLWQTQSRTAHVACCLGVLLVLVERYGPSAKNGRLRIAVLGVSSVLGLALIGYGFQNLDQISYDSHFALRSLQFRLQYWVGSLRALAESPIFGTGPGNFRQIYLQHKLAASSEQIADPHNALLDVWANGGLIAFAGLLIMGGVFLVRYLKSDQMTSGSETKSLFQGWLSSPWFLGAELALLGLFLGQLLTSGVADWEIVALLFAVPVLDVLLQTVSLQIPAQLVKISVLVLGVHLLGAGGMEMPGIVLIGLSLMAVSSSNPPKCCAATSARDAFVIGLASLAFVGGMWITTTGPVRATSISMQEARSEWMLDGNISRSREAFLNAADADRYSATPWRSLGELEYSLWQANPDDMIAFERAHEAWEEASKRDPHSAKDAHRRASAYWTASQFHESPDMAEKAVNWYEQADLKMPHDEQIQSQLALAAEIAKFSEKSRNAAKRAIELDEMSRKNGHWEKMLSDELRLRMETILEE